MDAVTEIYGEYTRMREHDLETSEALMALREYIYALSTNERQFLAKKLREWEAKQTSAEKGSLQDSPSFVMPTEEIWIECPNCHHKNRTLEIFCYSCGQILQNLDHLDTRRFSSAIGDLLTEGHFGDDSLLVLQAKEETGRFELRPQQYMREIIIGRSTKKQKIRPTVDLVTVKAAELGVSRLHLALIYDTKEELIQIRDLGSMNGTYINKKKLHPSERHILRHGDTLHLAQLELQVIYIHPGQEIP